MVLDKKTPQWTEIKIFLIKGLFDKYFSRNQKVCVGMEFVTNPGDILTHTKNILGSS